MPIFASFRRVLWIVLAVSVVLRLGSALYQSTTTEALPGVVDEVSYHELAIRVLDGHGFSFSTGWWPATRANQPTAHWSYLYVLFLSAIYSVFGPAPLVARLVQAVLVGILHPWLAWRLGGRLFGPGVGLASAALTAVYGYFVFYGGALVTESLFFLAILWVLDASTALAMDGNGRAGRFAPWMLLGLAFASSVLLRQAFLLVVPAVLVWLAWTLSARRPGAERVSMAPAALAVRMALSLGILAVCILPWTARNYRAFGEFVPLNTNAGFVFFYGNHPIHGTSFVPLQPGSDYWPLVSETLSRELKALNEAELDRALFREGLGFVVSDPWRYVRLSLSRAVEYFKFWPSPDSGAMSNVVRVLSFGLALPLMLYGVVMTLSRKGSERSRGISGALVLLIASGVYSLAHVLTWSLVRYRLPVDAMMMPYAALAVVCLFHRVRDLVPLTRTSVRDSVRAT